MRVDVGQHSKQHGDERPDRDTWQKWLRNGRVSTIIWLIGVAVDVGLRLKHVPSPEIDGMVAGLTGLMIGNLTVKARNGEDKNND